ncbi:hypothetical protein AN219_36230, partial [Streptomyces nanshensis]
MAADEIEAADFEAFRPRASSPSSGQHTGKIIAGELLYRSSHRRPSRRGKGVVVGLASAVALGTVTFSLQVMNADRDVRGDRPAVSISPDPDIAAREAAEDADTSTPDQPDTGGSSQPADDGAGNGGEDDGKRPGSQPPPTNDENPAPPPPEDDAGGGSSQGGGDDGGDGDGDDGASNGGGAQGGGDGGGGDGGGDDGGDDGDDGDDGGGLLRGLIGLLFGGGGDDRD